MKILVINCGSSSMKFQVIDSDTEEMLCKGVCERIGGAGRMEYYPHGEHLIMDEDMPTHVEAFEVVVKTITDKKIGVIKDLSEIGAVGHRVVHGGEEFSEATLITDDVIAAVEKCNDLAPLHNPANIIGIRSCQKALPGVPMVGVFDTAFHQTMPEKAYLYGIPYKYYRDYKVRRYGFHGTSHSFVSERAAELIGKPYDQSRIIVCHLGNGASICAVKNGKSIDTSMGLSPLEGLIMGTRSGDIDPSAVQYIAHKENTDIDGVIDILNKKSGVLGLSEISNDFRDITDRMEAGDKHAKTVLETYSYRIAKYIGAYIAAMHGVDCIAFTAGVGENNQYIRQMAIDYFDYMGIKMDPEANKAIRCEKLLSAPDSTVPVWMIPTNEELSIARQTVSVLKKAGLVKN
jgi:acetate kinase